MAVVKMNKFTILTFERFKSRLLKQLQIFEGVHFKDLQDDDMQALDFLKKDSSREQITHLEGELAKIKFMLEKIMPYVDIPKGIKALTLKPETFTFEEFDSFIEKYNYSEIYDQLKTLDEQQKSIRTEKNKLKTENDNLKLWTKLDVSSKEFDQFKQVSSFVGIVNKTEPDVIINTINSAFSDSYVEVIEKVKDETAVLVIVHSEKQEEALTALKNIGFTKAGVNLSFVPVEQIKVNNERSEALDLELEEINNHIAKMAGEYKNINIALDYFKTVLERAKASENFMKLKDVLVIEGWVPAEDFDKFEAILNECCAKDYYLEKEEVERESLEVPIKLKNNKVVAAFEDITNMYALPHYNEMDPTPLLTPFYILFFGFMIGDMAYGLILLLVSTLSLTMFNLGTGTRNFMKFLQILSFSVIFAGVLFGSLFGYTVFTPIQYMADTGELTYKAILDVKLDITFMIIVSVVVGVIHVLFGIFVKGYALAKEGKFLDALFDSLFWILCLLGGIGYLLGISGIIDPTLTDISMWTFYIMLIGLTLTQGRENKTIGSKLAGGLFGVYGITGYIGDFVSYTRIVALALSSAYISMSFNQMIDLLPNIITKILIGALIFVLSQALNLGLSVLGAYVHTCRLQYVEFFGKFYEGGGKPFKPLKLMNQYIKIK